jgi:hypothetical protein
MTHLEGQCHCGAVKVRLDTPRSTYDLAYRACQCGFCTRHGAATTSDPEARIVFAAEGDALTRYRFGQRLSNFLICKSCGCYVGSATEINGAWYGIINVRGCDLPGFGGRTPKAMNYDGETPEVRIARRKARWSPAVLTTFQTSA